MTRAMERLPPEILEQIIGYLAPDYSGWKDDDQLPSCGGREAGSLAPYVTISRQWQSQIERLTFAHVCLTTDRLSNGEAKRILTARRIGLIRAIDLHVVIKPHSEQPNRTWYMVGEKQQYRNAAFLETLELLFTLLKPFDSPGVPKKALSIVAHGPSDSACCPGDSQLSLQWDNEDMSAARFHRSYLQLLDNDLPSLDMVSTFMIPDPYPGYENISPSACCAIAARFPQLRSARWTLYDLYDERDSSIRHELRAAFADSLVLIPPSLRHFEMIYRPDKPKYQRYGLEEPTLEIKMNLEPEPLSTALHHLCQQLATAKIKASLTSDFFWPPPPPSLSSSSSDFAIAAATLDPRWPRLHTLVLSLAATDPNGQWLRDPRTEHCNGKRFRVTANVPLVADWLLRAGRAAARMPKLRALRIECGGSLGRRSDRSSCVTIECVPGLEPSKHARETWGEVARAHGHHLADPELVFYDPRQGTRQSR
ncbi:hypothetical protein BX600DRAFT_436384 [Xylariales sp. PMI_506]|nr:hypothetical protein BX600DRAFT_436384 [Xylariales sp. PMI_506]